MAVFRKGATLVAASLIALGLSACGGGGGGGGGSSGGAAAPPAFVTGPYGKAQGVYVPNIANGNITDRSPTAGQNVTLNQPANGQSPSFAIAGTMSGGTTTPTQSGYTTLGSFYSINDTGYLSNDASTLLLVNKSAGSNAPLTDAAYGTYVYNPAGSTVGQVGGFFTGTPTSQAQMPGNITATYTGDFSGYRVVAGSSQLVALTGNSSLTANFGAGTVNGSITNIVNQATLSNQTYGLSLAGTITGNTYAGTVGYTAAGSGTGTPTVTSSALNGGFFGNGATQTAGSLQITGNAPTSTGAVGPITVVGGFGGRR